MYHMIYLKQLMNSTYESVIDGPSFMSRTSLKRKLPELKSIHGDWGVLMHEAQMLDSRLNLTALFTAATDHLIPGMKGTTLANYVEFKDFIKND